MKMTQLVSAFADRTRRRRTIGRGSGLARGFLRGRAGVSIGSGVRMRGGGQFAFERGSIIGNKAHFYVKSGACIRAHAGASIGGECIVNIASGLDVGLGTQISWRCQILDTDFHTVLSESGAPRVSSAPVVVGNYVLIGTGSIILKGVTIGDHSVVGAGSVVTASVEPYTIVAGNPARPVGKTAGWI